MNLVLASVAVVCLLCSGLIARLILWVVCDEKAAEEEPADKADDG